MGFKFQAFPKDFGKTIGKFLVCFLGISIKVWNYDLTDLTDDDK